ncbi:GNAT family N-acetyltransferase [Magnetospira sp. QH-2]|uniref:GNAT family N-acetyltransferase n=1 Tax=Magnetospira sp. (strain QH-2) TaxID=1288970 RepID=UPI0003E81170|nr:N-acetyltransferase [Magnetospira sp. QH-2]CCQ74301.1 Putative acyltransferase with acyl-CoA N-acyltransferase domain [Magnetospira sp. QH-2]
MIYLTNERPGHAAPIETLLDQAFGTDRKAKQSYAYRRDVAPLANLSLVALDRGRLGGTIRYWPVSIGREEVPALLLGPVAVDSSLRKFGIGARLIEQSLAKAAAQGHGLVLLVGDPGYYERFGFHRTSAITMPGEHPHRLQVRELIPGALKGVQGPVWPEAPSRRRAMAATG